MRHLAFANDHILAQVVEEPRDLAVADAVVVNLSPEPMITGGDHPAIVAPWRSTWLRGGAIKSARRAGLFRVTRATNLGSMMYKGWDHLANRIRSFPSDTPLYISPFDHLGAVSTDPLVFTNERGIDEAPQDFDLRLNLWWSPGNTDCFIHNEHSFLEVHTQIHGSGRMQKFRERDETTLYEDVVMPIGYTHEPFCRVTAPNQWTYPWHRYYADTDSIWLAIELHPRA
jgi:hypothetical protein